MKQPIDFELFESILWEPDRGFLLLNDHIDRLMKSAVYFEFPTTEAEIQATLKTLIRSLKQEPYKIRLYLFQDGRLRTEATLVSDIALPSPVRIGLAKEPIRSDDPLIIHKTTDRSRYEDALASRPDCDDALLWNEREEITESSRANVVVKLGGVLYTPPVECGLLAGTYRAWLLAQGEVEERIIRTEEVCDCEGIFLISSIRRLYEAVFVPVQSE